MKSNRIEFSREDLVNLLCTATYGCEWLGIKTLKSEKHLDDAFDSEYLESRCCEDKWADRLLAGGHIVAIDYYPEIEDDEPAERYELTYDDICERASKCYEECPKNLSNFISDYYDYFDANNILQVIMFGEVVYG